jgi:hypothetical protein
MPYDICSIHKKTVVDDNEISSDSDKYKPLLTANIIHETKPQIHFLKKFC